MAFNRLILYYEFVDSVYRKTKSDGADVIIRDQHILGACEYFLGATMRKYCDHKGKEKNPQVTGRIVQQIGCIYRMRSPDKMSLIKAAVLFNAALQRQPSNIGEVENDLKELCAHILDLAGAPDRNVDVLKQAKNAKDEMGKLREMVQEELNGPPSVRLDDEAQKMAKIVSVENLQNRITEGYRSTMQHIMEFCVNALGPAPCKYALVGMGSLAKKEITPYSDFENLIVLQDGIQNEKNYESVLEFYRWVAVLFQVILISMGETILPFMDIFALRGWLYDAFTTCGVSPDGFAPQASKNPLGRQQGTSAKPWTTELIRPVKEMLKYTKPIHDLKNGYHLADMLGKTCFVAGDEGLYGDFASGVRENVGSQEKKFFEEVRADLKSFSVMSRLPYVQDSQQLDVKRVLFRVTTLFISALGRFKGIHSISSFEIARELHRIGAINESFLNDILFALAVACEVRLKVYSSQQAQADRLRNRKRENESTIVDLLGEDTAVQYFEIAWKLQCFVARIVNSDQQEMNDDPQMTRIWIYYSLGRWSQSLEAFNKLGVLHLPPGEIDTKQALLIGLCYQKLEQYWKALDYFKVVENKLKDSESLDLLVSQREMRDCLMKTGHVSEAFQLLEKNHDFYNKLAQGVGLPPLSDAVQLMAKNKVPHPQIDPRLENHHAIAKRLHYSGNVCRGRQNNDLALEFYNRELEIRKRLTADPIHDKKIAKCYLYMGECLINLRRLEEAENILRRAEAMYEVNNFTPAKDMVLEMSLGQIAIFKKDFDRSMMHFRKQLDLELQREDLNHQRIGSCHCGLGANLLYKGEFEASLEQYRMAREVFLKSKVETLRDAGLALCNDCMNEVFRQQKLKAREEQPHTSSSNS